jgi:hypothetical protein
VPTIRALKEYLVEEAKVKREMDISKEDIVGMHAKVNSYSIIFNRRSLYKAITATAESSWYILSRNSSVTQIDICPISW